MEFLKEWTICICITLVVAVIFSLLSPRGNMNTFFKMMLSVFIFVSFLYPLKGADVDSISFDYSLKESDYTMQREESIEVMLSNRIKQVLNDENICNASVKTNVLIKDDNIEINEVQVAVTDEYDLSQVEKLIFDKLGINAKVIHIGD